MIGLDSQFHDAPIVLLCDLLNDLFQTVMDMIYQDLAPALGAEDNMVEDMVNRMLFVNIFFCYHVDEYITKNICFQHILSTLLIFAHHPTSLMARPVHPPDKSRGLSWPSSVRGKTLPRCK